MKIKKKVKRISSVVLCMLMLLTALPMTAITANAAAQAYIKYIDTGLKVSVCRLQTTPFPPVG